MDYAQEIKETLDGLKDYVLEMIGEAQSGEELMIGLAVTLFFAVLVAVYMKFNDIHYDDVVHGVESLADQVVQRIGDVKAQIQGWIGN